MIAGDGKTIHELEKTAAEDDPDRIAARVQELVLPIRYLNASIRMLSLGWENTRGRKRGQDGRAKRRALTEKPRKSSHGTSARQPPRATPNW